MNLNNKHLVYFLLSLLAWGCASPPPSPQSVLEDVYTNAEASGLCDGEMDKDLLPESSLMFAINSRQHLFQILCFRGAYQNNYQYLLYKYKDGNVFVLPLELETFEVRTDGQMSKRVRKIVSGTVDFNPTDKTLTVVEKYRGLGDCGSLGRYQLVAKDWKWKLLEYRVKSSCDGQYLEPEQYTKVF